MLTGNPWDADDLAQETFLVVARRGADFEGRSSLYTWLYGILLNLGAASGAAGNGDASFACSGAATRPRFRRLPRPAWPWKRPSGAAACGPWWPACPPGRRGAAAPL